MGYACVIDSQALHGARANATGKWRVGVFFSASNDPEAHSSADPIFGVEGLAGHGRPSAASKYSCSLWGSVPGQHLGGVQEKTQPKARNNNTDCGNVLGMLNATRHLYLPQMGCDQKRLGNAKKTHKTQKI